MREGEAVSGAPLTHFFHCWRFPDHHACAVALIERQSRENDRLLAEKAAFERQLREAKRDPPKRDPASTVAASVVIRNQPQPHNRHARPQPSPRPQTAEAPDLVEL